MPATSPPLGHPCDRDAIELVAAHDSADARQISRPVLRAPDVSLELQSALPEEVRKPGRVQAEGPLFAGFLQGREECLGARKGSRVVENRAIDVGEQELASRGGSRAPSQRRVDGGFGQIVGDALPKDERARLCRIAGGVHDAAVLGRAVRINSPVSLR